MVSSESFALGGSVCFFMWVLDQGLVMVACLRGNAVDSGWRSVCDMYFG